MTGLAPERVLQGVAMVLADGPPPRLPDDYAATDVSRKIARIILSHTDFVRRTVWREG
jgi:UDP-N-acetylglucosamine 2-epimerase (non-hydrolysing)